ncbi:hypothetical protein [Noviherbaspirillum cavernae]|nr:hypothetical protein [Noviherbaspirillum cavernae]
MQKILSRFLFACASGLAFLSMPASAVVFGSDAVTVTRYYIYAEINGDVIFWYSPATAIPGCDGGWISGTQAGTKSMVATLIAAKASSAPMTIFLNTESLWSGSGSRFCKVDAMGLS